MAKFTVDKNSVEFEFICPKCGEMIRYQFDEIPYPDMFAENVVDSERCDSRTIQCGKCMCEYNAEAFRNMYEGTLYVKHNEEELDVKILENS